MRVFVTGVAGQLGHDVVNELVKRGHTAIGSDLAKTYSGIQDGSAVTEAEYVSLDLTKRYKLIDTITGLKPDAVIHCAAWTQVDAAQEPENGELVFRINAYAPRDISLACSRIDAKMLYISTDYVFDGSGEKPWKPEQHPYQPLSQYGGTKAFGEFGTMMFLDKYFIVRIAWVFGKSGKNFVKTMLDLGKKYPSVRVVNDQIGTPTYTYDLARLLVDMIETDKYGVYHATNEGGYISWYDFACEIFRQAGMNTEVIPVTTEEYGVTKAQRPKNSRLDKSKLKECGFTPLPDWQDALNRYLKEIGEI